MKFATIFTAFISLFTFTLAQQVTLDDLIAELKKRDNFELTERGLLDIATSFFNLSSFYDEADSVAGWINNFIGPDPELLVTSLDFIGSTDLVPISVVYVLGNSFLKGIVVNALSESLDLVLDTDLTPVFVILKNSNLGYTLVADVVKNKNTLPFLEKVVNDLIASGALDLGSLISGITGGLSGSSPTTTEAVALTATVQNSQTVTQTIQASSTDSSSSGGIASSLLDFVGSLFKRDIPEVEYISKRDNIEDLATTILSAVAKSTVINDTLDYLFTSEEFEKEVVAIIEGLLKDLPSLLRFILSLDLSKLTKIAFQLYDSGLLSDILTKAWNDQSLIDALENDFEALIGGTISAGNSTKSDDVEFPSVGKIFAALLDEFGNIIGGSSGSSESTGVSVAQTAIPTLDSDFLAPENTKVAVTEAAVTTGPELVGPATTPKLSVSDSISTAIEDASSYIVSEVEGGSNKLSNSIFATIAMSLLMFV